VSATNPPALQSPAFGNPAYAKSAYVPVNTVANVDYRADYCVIGGGFAGTKAIETIAVAGNQTNWLLIEMTGRLGGRTKVDAMGNGTTAHTPNPWYYVEQHGQWMQGNLSHRILALGAEMATYHGPYGGSPQGFCRHVDSFYGNVCGALRGGDSKWLEYDYYDALGRNVTRAVNRGDTRESFVRAYNAYFDAFVCTYCGELGAAVTNGSIKDMSLTDGYATCGLYPRTEEEFAVLSAFVAVEWGESSDTTSLANSVYWNAYNFYDVDSPSGTANFVNDPRGVGVVAEYVLVRKGINPQDSRIHYRTKVSNINTDNMVITARQPDANGQKHTVTYQCKFIINTIAIGAIQASLREQTNLVTPLPPLAVQASLHKYHMVEYRKVFIQWNNKFWGDKAHFVLTTEDQGLMLNSWTSIDYPLYQPGSKILLGSHNGPDSNRFVNMPDDEYVSRVCAELVRAFGSGASFANVTSWNIGHDTYDDELRGCYSNRPATMDENEFHTLFAPVKGRYFLSGEAACDLLNGYILGAHLIGESSALHALVNAGVLPASTRPYDNDCSRPPPGYNPLTSYYGASYC